MERNGEFDDEHGRANPQRPGTQSDLRSHSTESIAEGIEHLSLKIDGLTAKIGQLEHIILEAFADPSRKREMVSLSQPSTTMKSNNKDISSIPFVKQSEDPCLSPHRNVEIKHAKALALVAKQETEIEARRKEEREQRAAEMHKKLEEERRQAETERQRKLALDAKRRNLINTLFTPKSGDTLFGDEKKEGASIFDE
ncbi:hypothetical protein IE077_000145 [Cardiosporidium cionae]|uniref:Uncharacterized protein n=1 Tax=Cardiosporidium cionae TaxID=476202 RepID=A0ABQ7JCZ8_9APIC|nr:hypothetical protein IE077_000145 [Cardiosporidium cionae]|eukprot:KAF8821918.1 hypothetical protein IE077_000145 [Cardiosporidium cionae]